MRHLADHPGTRRGMRLRQATRIERSDRPRKVSLGLQRRARMRADSRLTRFLRIAREMTGTP